MAKAKNTGAAARFARDVINGAIVSCKEEIASAKARLANVRKARHDFLQPVLTRIAMIIESVPDKNKTVRVQAYSASFCKPDIRVNLLRQSSLKSDVICELLAYANDLCPRASTHDYVSESWGERVHNFRGELFTIIVSIDTAEEGTCRKVLTGTKMVEQKQYEFVCDD